MAPLSPIASNIHTTNTTDVRQPEQPLVQLLQPSIAQPTTVLPPHWRPGVEQAWMVSSLTRWMVEESTLIQTDWEMHFGHHHQPEHRLLIAPFITSFYTSAFLQLCASKFCQGAFNWSLFSKCSRTCALKRVFGGTSYWRRTMPAVTMTNSKNMAQRVSPWESPRKSHCGQTLSGV